MTTDTSNKFFVGVQGNDVVFLRPIPQKISREDALVLAAWIVSIADIKDDFGLIIEKVQS